MAKDSNEIIVVDGETRLIVAGKGANGNVKYAEEYYRWRTGNHFEFPEILNANEVAEAYKKVRK